MIRANRQRRNLDDEKKILHEIHERNAELQRNFEELLHHSDAERTRLTDQLEKLQSDFRFALGIYFRAKLIF